MPNEMKIDLEQFDKLTELLEDMGGYTDQVANILSRINEKIDDLTGAVKAVESALESLPHD